MNAPVGRSQQGRSQSFSLWVPYLSFLPFPSPPSPNLARGSVSAVSPHSGVWGWIPAANAFQGYFEARKRFWWQCFFCSFSEDKKLYWVYGYDEFVLKFLSHHFWGLSYKPLKYGPQLERYYCSQVSMSSQNCGKYYYYYYYYYYLWPLWLFYYY